MCLFALWFYNTKVHLWGHPNHDILRQLKGDTLLHHKEPKQKVSYIGGQIFWSLLSEDYSNFSMASKNIKHNWGFT